MLKSCKVARAASITDWNGKGLGAISCAVHKSTHMQETHRKEACPKAKVGGDMKKGPFKLSLLDSASVITDGVLSMQPTMLVSIASPPPVVNTHTHTHFGSSQEK